MAKMVKAPRSRVRIMSSRMIRLGLFGGGRWRLNLGLGLLALSAMRRLIQRDERIVYREVIHPGQQLSITHLNESLK